jgi:hypothetical protein
MPQRVNCHVYGIDYLRYGHANFKRFLDFLNEDMRAWHEHEISLKSRGRMKKSKELVEVFRAPDEGRC